MRAGSAAAAGAGGVVLSLLIGEALVRAVNPTPRAQVLVEGRNITLGETDGVVTWRTRDPEVDEEACAHSAAPRHAVVVGSSILRGSGTTGPYVFTEQLRDRAEAAGWCVDNLSQPAFSSEQKRVVALEALRRARPPDRLYWEVWQNDGGRYLRHEDMAINLGGYELDSAGRPRWGSLPEAISGPLFEGSALWRYAVIALGASPADQHDPVERWRKILDADLLPVVEQAKRTGTEVVLVVCPALDRSFAESEAKPHRGLGALWTFAGQHHLRWIRLEAALAGKDYLALRADPCCHYNDVGHAALAEVFASDLVNGRPAAAAPP